MDAVSFLNQHINIELLLQHYNFEKIHSDGNMIRACCKLHGGNNPTAFVANRNNGLWYCHTSNCGGGDIYTLVQKLENIDFVSSVKWLADFFKVNINNLSLSGRNKNYVNEISNFITLMRKNRKKSFKEFHINEHIREVTKFRNFNKSTIDFFNLGYVDKVNLLKRDGTHYTLYKRLAFPIMFNNIQIGTSFRRTKSYDMPKWSHQPVHLKYGNILYNYDSIVNQPHFAICEGITDVWAYHEIDIPAAATFGAHITNEQYKLLLKTGADLILSFDGDKAGQSVTDKAIDLFYHKANLEIVSFNDFEDPESITRKELKYRFDCRKKLISQNKRWR